MDTLKGFIYLETHEGIENLCLAIEDPENPQWTRVIKCKDKKARYGEVRFSKKKGGIWKFKAFRFSGNIKEVEVVKKSIIKFLPGISKNCFEQISLTELRKLEGWID